MNDVRDNFPSTSSMWRTSECPGWLQLSKDIPRKDTKDSLAGTAGHAALAGEAVDLDSKMEMTVEACREIADRIVKEFGFEGCEVLKEKRFWAESNGQKICSGQVDELYFRPDMFLIIDYKTLFGEHQEAASNWQLRTLDYVVGSQIESLEMNSACAIVQPWKKGQFSTVEYSPESRKESERDILAVVKAAMTPDAPRRPGEW